MRLALLVSTNTVESIFNRLSPEAAWQQGRRPDGSSTPGRWSCFAGLPVDDGVPACRGARPSGSQRASAAAAAEAAEPGRGEAQCSEAEVRQTQPACTSARSDLADDVVDDAERQDVMPTPPPPAPPIGPGDHDFELDEIVFGSV